MKLPLVLPSALAVLALTLSGSALGEPSRARPSRPLMRLAKAGPAMQLRGQAQPSGVSIEVRDTAPARATLFSRFSLPITDRGGAHVVSSTSDHEYRISVRRDDNAPDSPIVFDLERSQRGPDSHVSEAKLRAVVRMKPGQRVVVARIERSDGTRTEVVATLK